LRVRIIERTAIVRFPDVEMLFHEDIVQSLGDQLDRLIAEAGLTRLLLNLQGVRFLSGAMLGRFVGLQRKLEPGCGPVQVCRLDPMLRDILRITHLDRVFDVCADEAEALGLMVP
jgi:anti-anti-sigma factor